MTTPLSADDLSEVAGAYRLSAAVMAMAELGLPDLLAGGPMRAGSLAAQLGVDEHALGVFLRMLASRGALVEDADGRFANSGLSAALVAGPQRDMILGWVALPEFFGAWAALAPALRTGRTPFATAFDVGLHEYLGRDARANAAYSAAMGSTVESFAAIADAVDLADCEVVVAVGGGQGVELVPLLRRRPELRGILFDLANAVDGAAGVLADHGVADRVEIAIGDAREQVPHGDLYVLSTVLRCMGDDDAVAVLASCRRAGTDGARTLVVEMPLDDGPGEHPSATAALTAWVVYGGADRTRDQWAQLHERAGLTIEQTIDLDDRFAMFVGAKTTERHTR